jgi:hypothetical protein
MLVFYVFVMVVDASLGSLESGICVNKIRQIFDKGNILILRDTNYIQSLQQRNTLMTVWMHIAKKDKRN